MTKELELNIQDRKLNDLQLSFYKSFCSAFPDLKTDIEFIPGIIAEENFCFQITAPSEKFGTITFDIDNIEITVFTDFDHRHFPTYFHDREKDIQKQIDLTCKSVIEYVKDFFTGNLIIEIHTKGDRILKTVYYLRDKPKKKIQSAFYLSKDLVTEKFKNIFGLKSADSTIITRLNWFGHVD